ncbi:hypothetical protein SAMN05216278_2668 [Halopelagius longus]|uniref:Uncharacterized protein n=1 Tax=Halopelagius longus TaxID=1236180 RepID=A0A1H1E0B3_9EURY|nr:hypothetical protein SAMN05216278_2668 [Halopelagius longus]
MQTGTPLPRRIDTEQQYDRSLSTTGERRVREVER